MKNYFSRLTDSEALDVIGRFVPDFGLALRDLQQIRLKYFLLMDRLKKLAPPPLKQTILSDKQCELSGVTRDFQLNF